MPSSFDALVLTPQTTDDVPIEVTQYEGTVENLITMNNSFENSLFEVDANAVLYAGQALSLRQIGTGTMQTLQAATAVAQADIITLPQVTGTMLVAGSANDPATAGKVAMVNRTNQGADIATAKLTDTTPAGFYAVFAALECTTADAAAGTATLTVSWTDDAGAASNSATAKVLTSTGRATLDLLLYLASGNITWSVGHSGSYGTAKFALRARCFYLG